MMVHRAAVSSGMHLRDIHMTAQAAPGGRVQVIAALLRVPPAHGGRAAAPARCAACCSQWQAAAWMHGVSRMPGSIRPAGARRNAGLQIVSRATLLCELCQHTLIGHAHMRAGPTVFRRCWGIRLCDNRECFRIFWQRDTNAAINLLNIFGHWLHGMPKPAAFQRPQEAAAAGGAVAAVAEQQQQAPSAQQAAATLAAQQAPAAQQAQAAQQAAAVQQVVQQFWAGLPLHAQQAAAQPAQAPQQAGAAAPVDPQDWWAGLIPQVQVAGVANMQQAPGAGHAAAGMLQQQQQQQQQQQLLLAAPPPAPPAILAPPPEPQPPG